MNFFQKRYYQKILSGPQGKRRSARVPQLYDCKSVCFLCRYTAEADLLQQISLFKNFHKDFHVLMYVEGKPYLGAAFNKLNVQPFYADNFNFFGHVSSEAMFNLLSQHYDLLVDTIPELKETTALIHHWIDADFKIGRDISYEKLSDLNILLEKDADTSVYLETVKSYISKLKNNQ